MSTLRKPAPGHSMAASVAALVAGMAAALIVPVLLTGEPGDGLSVTFARGRYFWHKVAAFEIVLLVAWALEQSFAHRLFEKPRHAGGASVVGRVVRATGCALLLALILGSALASDDVIIWFITAAVVVVAAIVVLESILVQAAAAQVAGAEQIASSVPDPDALVVILRSVERGIQPEDPEAAAEVKRIRERIAHSLPRVGQIASSPGYEQLVAKVMELREVAHGPGGGRSARTACADATGLLDSLQVELRQT
jgi:small-conductance mechanosensitive channel